MKNSKKLLHDIIKSIKIGLFLGVICGIVFFLLGFLIGKNLENGLEVGKNGTLLISSLGIFLVAGAIMIKGKSKEELPHYLKQWKEVFYLLNFKWVLAIICFVFLGIASLFDWLLFIC